MYTYRVFRLKDAEYIGDICGHIDRLLRNSSLADVNLRGSVYFFQQFLRILILGAYCMSLSGGSVAGGM